MGIPEVFRMAASTAVVTGSGLAPVRWPGRIAASVAYGETGVLAEPAVEGHPGKLILLETSKGPLIVFAGRTHLYEGGEAGGAAAAAASLGCRRIILTHAAGSLKRSLPVGSWLAPSGAVSLPWSVLDECGGRPTVSARLRKSAAAAALAAGIEVRGGTIYWTPGPMYETPAEASAAALMGADAATMSPLPELCAAAENGLEVASLAFITNFAPSVKGCPTGHEEVLKAGRKGSQELFRMLPELAGI
jgi:purine-nucleoside phosphorylase